MWAIILLIVVAAIVIWRKNRVDTRVTITPGTGTGGGTGGDEGDNNKGQTEAAKVVVPQASALALSVEAPKARPRKKYGTRKTSSPVKPKPSKQK